MSADRQTTEDEGRKYAMALLRKVAEQAAANQVLIQQNIALAEQMTAQQMSNSDLASAVRALSSQLSTLAGSVEDLTAKVDVLSQVALTDEEFAHASANSAMAGAGRQVFGQVVNGLLGGFRPGVQPPRGPVPRAFPPPGHPPRGYQPPPPQGWNGGRR